MTRLGLALVLPGLLVAACGEPAPTLAATEPAPVTEPVPMPSAEPAAPAPDARIGTINLKCGGEDFRVAFLDTHAASVNADGSAIELALLAPDANSAPGVSVYTDGKMTFTKQGGGDAPTVIRFARGRMAFQDCAIAQN